MELLEIDQFREYVDLAKKIAQKKTWLLVMVV